jgi:hypothetical protein
VKRALVCLAVAGCIHYEPGSFAGVGPWPGGRVALSCLDLAVEVYRSDQVTGPVVAYRFGNHCTHDAIVDLAAARVIAWDASGRELHLAPIDPRHEIRPLALPALTSGEERIEYNGDFAERDLDRVCVYLEAVDRLSDGTTISSCKRGGLEARL